VAIIHAVIMKAERGSSHQETYERVDAVRQCPYCAETIKAAAVVCKHCGREVTPTAAEAVKPVPLQATINPTSKRRSGVSWGARHS
jgi:hypothetical protein